MRYLGVINETSYLSVPNASQYRTIMRIFYQEYEKMRFQLYKEDVLELLHRNPAYEDYSMEQLKLDLDALIRWKNLTPIQDPGKVYTIADYKNKQYRYVMSEYAVEIERLTVRLENIFVESGNLSTNLFVRLERSLEETEEIEGKSYKEINEWWSNLQEDFKRLNRNYQDYLREFYSGKSDRLMKSVEFILHKDRFIQYLNEFIKEMQKHSRYIARLLTQKGGQIEGQLLDKVVRSEMEIPRALSELQMNMEESIRENVWGKWNSLKSWFLDAPEHECESRKVLIITNDIIRNIIQNAALILQMQNWGMSRKDDYRKFLELFLQANTLDEAHRISAHVFGIQNIQHLKENAVRDTDSINSSVYDEVPFAYSLKPHTKAYRERRRQSGFADKTMEKLQHRMAYLRQLDGEKELVMRYIRDGRLDLTAIEDVIPDSVRITFLRWISQANMNSGKIGRTEYGQEFRLVRKPGTCVLHCEDGDLTMPAYVLEYGPQSQ